MSTRKLAPTFASNDAERYDARDSGRSRCRLLAYLRTVARTSAAGMTTIIATNACVTARLSFVTDLATRLARNAL